MAKDGTVVYDPSQTQKDAIMTNSEAYNTGYEAAAQDEPRSANPYAIGTWDSDQWFSGWDDEADCPSCGHPKDGSSGSGHCDDPCHNAS